MILGYWDVGISLGLIMVIVDVWVMIDIGVYIGVVLFVDFVLNVLSVVGFDY